jgi:hypothetical protein
MLVMFVCSLAAAVFGGLYRSLHDDDFSTYAFFLALVVGGPMAVMVMISLIHPARTLWRQWRDRSDS